MHLPFDRRHICDAPEPTPDLQKSSAKITLHGHSTVYIENYRCVLSCTDTRVLIKMKKEIISVTGNCLKIDYYCPEELKLSGIIQGISYVDAESLNRKE